jgi:hypothetical protein
MATQHRIDAEIPFRILSQSVTDATAEALMEAEEAVSQTRRWERRKPSPSKGDGSRWTWHLPESA